MYSSLALLLLLFAAISREALGQPGPPSCHCTTRPLSLDSQAFALSLDPVAEWDEAKALCSSCSLSLADVSSGVLQAGFSALNESVRFPSPSEWVRI